MITTQNAYLEVEIQTNDTYSCRTPIKIIEALPTLFPSTDEYDVSCKLEDDDFGGDDYSALLLSFHFVKKNVQIEGDQVLNWWERDHFIKVIQDDLAKAGYTVLDNESIRDDNEIFVDDISDDIEYPWTTLNQEHECEHEL